MVVGAPEKGGERAREVSGAVDVGERKTSFLEAVCVRVMS